jgi:Response regulator containing a CheY-like receiver domain and an HTH DNA-binding domain
MKLDKQGIKVLITDDHELIRQGLKRIISLEEDLIIVGEAENGKKALEIINSNKPDVVLIDINMPIMTGIETLQTVKQKEQNIKFIMLTVENDRKTIHEAIDVGADGYILKDSAGTEIVDAIRTVYSGEKYIDKSLVSLFFMDIKNKNTKKQSIFDQLSQREVEVLLKISQGFSNKEVGEQLFLSEKTIKNYATNLFRKINAKDRVQATIIAMQNNIEEYYESKLSE